MRRSAIRSAILVLAFLGAPVALHVVIHDLEGYRGHHHAESLDAAGNHRGHEHPVTPSVSPQLGRLAGALVVFFASSRQIPAAAPLRGTLGHRNSIAFGAIRLDDDVGAQALLSTFRI